MAKDGITLVIATGNQGKVLEIQSLLKNYPVTLKCLNDFGPIPPVIEDGETFDDNAYKKASFTANILGFPALADDSGLVVEALSGAPGVHSARYGGKGLNDEARCRKLLKEMENIENRKAHFQCVVSIAVPGGPALTYEATCEGLISMEMTGQNGFGYDPVFYYPPLKKSFAQMTLEEKNQISHRGKTLHEIQDEFEKILKWIQQQLPVQEKFDCITD
ncbi:MAG: XTP/dITP diphosphatase [Desulfobacteraceae bacterium]|nr:XTP/dITP diphosphatase [Desulfobacteraceae bacterium]MBU4001500.1 XTP/dITP diphosphatase [Pseudomonadota bacterium]MBU4053155.1 XTP/dITP diphosphatase [Pseudomonadota bacterium]